jgi:hypothetical protein
LKSDVVGGVPRRFKTLTLQTYDAIERWGH